MVVVVVDKNSSTRVGGKYIACRGIRNDLPRYDRDRFKSMREE